MKSKNLKYITVTLILLLSIELNAQSKEMQRNENHINFDFIPASELKTKFNKQSTNESEIKLFLEKKNDSIFSIYVQNNTLDTISILRQGWQLF